MSKAAIAVFVLCIAFGQSVFSDELVKEIDPAQYRCNVGDDNVIANLLSEIDTIDKLLPSVPPEEQRYLDHEEARALKLINAQLPSSPQFKKGDRVFYKMSLRPYYPVWNLRKRIEPARLALRRIAKREPHPENGDADFITYQNNPESEKLERATRAIFPLSEFTNELTRYADMKRTTLTTEEGNRFASARGMMEIDLGSFISCKLAKIMGKQPLPF